MAVATSRKHMYRAAMPQPVRDGTGSVRAGDQVHRSGRVPCDRPSAQ